MNKVILMGRLTRDPEIRYTSGENQTAVARYTLAVDRRFKRQGDEQTADFINCVVFGRGAEFAESYLHQGTKIVAVGRIQTGSYTNHDGWQCPEGGDPHFYKTINKKLLAELQCGNALKGATRISTLASRNPHK